MSAQETPPLHGAILRAKDELGQLEMFVNICVRALEKSTQAVQMVEVVQRLAKQSNLSEHIRTEEELLTVKEQAGAVEAFSQQQK